MPRPLRLAQAGYVFHVLNRSVARLTLFEKAGDFDAFEKVLHEALGRVPIRLLAYCVMPNHWHLVLWPRTDSEMSRFVGWLSLTHTQRWHAHHHTAGTGHLYQGRFKSFPVQEDDHFLAVCRYVERNALRAGLVREAEGWRWGSLWHRTRPNAGPPEWLAPWPVPPPEDWPDLVNRPQSEEEVESIRKSVVRGRPFGDPGWVESTARSLGLGLTLRPRGRPKTALRRSLEKGS